MAAGRVVEGYGVLQPRVTVTMSSAAGSLFARIWAGHTGVDPYTTAVSDTYQDLFGEGTFAGKGLADVDAFVEVTRGSDSGKCRALARPARRAVRQGWAGDRRGSCRRLSADGPRARASGSTDGFAATGRFSGGCCRSVPSRLGWHRNRLPLIARWKIFDNLRRSLTAPAMLALLLAGWVALPGAPLAWTALALVPMAFPIIEPLAGLIRAVGHRARWQSAPRKISGWPPREPAADHASSPPTRTIACTRF